MNIEIVKSFFMWCSILNFSLLLYYCSLIFFARKFVIRRVQKFIKLPEEQISTIIFSALSFLKLVLITFFIMPYIALLIISH